ncbi:uncharacterized protein K460DRAFT_292260 [Cucurbitaria berberidis CBS 394.84]|uniref:AA1-like domain-containing protein n=1 Tax=Cucurbitaria berberidis CBS 394.84 TaxID=1168544 RepID=A0A9P4GAV1_9PLEO|nr:uncharacterized protein K460DRAFT_292260 [Cucurbitaria berberidis CBS 394.84]KAF1841870.1 hypothetical protein K460DRAFT_292260 [Cucurbitaria berberidis CBS 394.84]
MQFITVASALFAAAVAAPAPQTTDCPNPAHCGPADTNQYENINIAEYSLRKNDGIQSVYFKLSGDNATDLTCQSGPIPTLPSDNVDCGEGTDYRFVVIKDPNGGSEPGLAINHQTAPFFGKTGTGSVPTYCHAGGNGPNDFVCSQVGAVTIVIK